jgi:hypothetical protein
MRLDEIAAGATTALKPYILTPGTGSDFTVRRSDNSAGFAAKPPAPPASEVFRLRQPPAGSDRRRRPPHHHQIGAAFARACALDAGLRLAGCA